MRIAWATDIHLDHAAPKHIEGFCEEILSANPDVLLLAGDIGEAPTVAGYLHFLEERLRRPVYFVLGNHDFYRGSIAGVRRCAELLSRQSRWLHWLPVMGIVPLTPEIGLIGHDGWADGRFGDFDRSPVVLNDYLQIEELRDLPKPLLLARLHELGDEAADYLGGMLAGALGRFSKIILLTHVPPFREACLYRSKPGAPAWLPHFTAKAMGETLRGIMQAHARREVMVLCGHTHHGTEVEVLPNLRVRVGQAVYGEPRLQAVLEL